MTVLKTSVIVLDCAEPESLARFYAELLGASAGPAPDDGELFLVTGGTGTLLGIRRDPQHTAPKLAAAGGLPARPPADPGGGGLLDEAEREAVALGARPVAAEEDGTRPDNRTTLRRYADPAGHAFVLATVRSAGG